MNSKGEIKIIETINSFQKAIQKRLEENLIQIENLKDEKNLINNEDTINLNFPADVLFVLKNLQSINIKYPRSFCFYSVSNVKVIENHFLQFALLNDTQRICFDTSKINSAGEWDIINYENKYLITMTMSSFLVNKVWAWLDRGRHIWEEEYFPRLA